MGRATARQCGITEPAFQSDHDASRYCIPFRFDDLPCLLHVQRVATLPTDASNLRGRFRVGERIGRNLQGQRPDFTKSVNAFTISEATGLRTEKPVRFYIHEPMKRTKPEAPKRKIHNRRRIYSLAPKKGEKAHRQSVNDGPTKFGTGVLRGEATAYHTQFTLVPDIGAPPDFGTGTPMVDEAPSTETSKELARIEKLNSEAEARWSDKLRVDNSLTRALVSFQANKERAVYRWFKYKEAFSAGLIEHLLKQVSNLQGSFARSVCRERDGVVCGRRTRHEG